MNQLYTAWEQAESACWEEPDSKSLVQMLKDVCKQQDPKLKPGQLMQPTRIALTGQAKGSVRIVCCFSQSINMVHAVSR